MENYWLPTNTIHRNGHSSINNNATEMCNKAKDSLCHLLYFDVWHISVALLLKELLPFL